MSGLTSTWSGTNNSLWSLDNPLSSSTTFSFDYRIDACMFRLTTVTWRHHTCTTKSSFKKILWGSVNKKSNNKTMYRIDTTHPFFYWRHMQWIGSRLSQNFDRELFKYTSNFCGIFQVDPNFFIIGFLDTNS